MYDDPDEARRYQGPFTSHHPVPTIKKYREEQEERRAKADEHDEVEHSNEVEERFMHSADGGGTDEEGANGEQQEQQEAGALQNRADDREQQDEDLKPAVDTSQADAAAEDPRARRKELKKRKDQRAEREVTDPVTHLPVVIHDFTSQALKEVPENEDRFGSTWQTATGVSNKRKSAKQLREELKYLQREHESTQALFPPPEFNTMKGELTHVYLYGVIFVLIGAALIIGLMWPIAVMLTSRMRRSSSKAQWSANVYIWALWAALGAIALANLWGLIVGVRDWMSKRIDAMWEDEVWDAGDQSSRRQEKANRTETVAWLNALLG